MPERKILLIQQHWGHLEHLGHSLGKPLSKLPKIFGAGRKKLDLIGEVPWTFRVLGALPWPVGTPLADVGRGETSLHLRLWCPYIKPCPAGLVWWVGAVSPLCPVGNHLDPAEIKSKYDEKPVGRPCIGKKGERKDMNCQTKKTPKIQFLLSPSILFFVTSCFGGKTISLAQRHC